MGSWDGWSGLFVGCEERWPTAHPAGGVTNRRPSYWVFSANTFVGGGGKGSHHHRDHQAMSGASYSHHPDPSTPLTSAPVPGMQDHIVTAITKYVTENGKTKPFRLLSLHICLCIFLNVKLV